MAGICGWFDVELADGIRISTSPDLPPTSWYQVVFPLSTSLEVAPGDRLRLWLSNDYHPPIIEWSWRVVLERSGNNVHSEVHSSSKGFPQHRVGIDTSFYPSF